MPKFDFSVTTRNGHKIESIQIYGLDLPNAERKLRQMYFHCEVTRCTIVDSGSKIALSAGIEDMLSLIINEASNSNLGDLV